MIRVSNVFVYFVTFVSAAPHHTDAAIGGDLIEQLGRSLRIAAGDFGGHAQPRQHAIAGRRLGGEIGEGGFGLRMLVGFRKLDGLVERSARFGRLLGLHIFVATPAADGSDDQNHRGNDIKRVSVPQLLELIATDLLVYFIK